MIGFIHLRPRFTPHRRGEQGYAILLVLFLATLILVGTLAVGPNILTEGRRQKEAEMIWRGKQYARAIKLYYRKTGKFPTSMDDLTKPKIGSLRFMRQAYKDPMNAKDGEWRLIYVGPTGQLIGSLKPPQTIQMSGLVGQIGTLPGTPAAQLAAQSAGQAAGNPGSAFAPPGNNAAQSPFGQPASAAPGSNTTAVDSTGGAANPTEAANEALLNAEPSSVIGGNIIGVGSSVNRRSITVYEKATNYKQFEFIWDPSKDAITVGGAPGQQIGTPAGAPIGTPAGQPSSFGNPPSSNPSAPGGTLNPQPGPPETTPAPAPPPQ